MYCRHSGPTRSASRSRLWTKPVPAVDSYRKCVGRGITTRPTPPPPRPPAPRAIGVQTVPVDRYLATKRKAECPNIRHWCLDKTEMSYVHGLQRVMQHRQPWRHASAENSATRPQDFKSPTTAVVPAATAHSAPVVSLTCVTTASSSLLCFVQRLAWDPFLCVLQCQR